MGEFSEFEIVGDVFEYERLVERLEKIKVSREHLEAHGMVEHAAEEYRKGWSERHGVDIRCSTRQTMVGVMATKMKKAMTRTREVIMKFRRSGRAIIRGVSVRLGRAVGDGYVAARQGEGERPIE